MGELFCKFCECLVKYDKRFMVESHHRSAKHQRGSYHKTESSQTFLKHAISDFAEKLLFVLFQPIGLFSNTAYKYALHSSFELKTQKIDRSK